ncbi:hypothetical protein J2Z65_006843 [Paenibacillus aceris]|uniref:Uncharacterized protein n=1 Tax=Paenibacillus aceris TaxID=869555 RepID=A0ABS4IAR0_9BACL|nr:hypothetical protein [Paenibacillus aceris]
MDQVVGLRRLASRVWCEVGLDAPALYEQSEVHSPILENVNVKKHAANRTINHTILSLLHINSVTD